MDKEIIPSISIIDEKPVIVEDEKYEPYVNDGIELDLWQALGELKDYDIVHLLDIRGIESNSPQTDAIRKVGTRKGVWADIGARGPEEITDCFIAGADKAIISTKTIRSKKSIKESIELSDELILSIDYKDGLVSPSDEIRKMGVKGVAEFALKEGFDKIIFTALGSKRFEERHLRSLPSGDYDLYIGGAGLKRAEYLDQENLKGFIFTLREAIRYQKN
ncbi:MAG: HisA/HisF-related TIM barrel protein [Candidatus Thermoplasmatota archaeon]